jgi:hypothetical protein
MMIANKIFRIVDFNKIFSHIKIQKNLKIFAFNPINKAALEING